MSASQQTTLVVESMLADLPEPVQRYLHFTGVLGRQWTHDVVLKYSGRFRQGLDRPWMPMTARQVYTTSPPSFIWDARFKVMGIPLLRARDEYRSGRAHMFARLAGIKTIFDVRGEQLDQGAMLRYLSEMIWFPIAFLGENITWQAVDDHSADVQLKDLGRVVSGRLYFDELGKVTNFTALRYREIDGNFSLDPWSTPITGYGKLAGLNLPTQGQATWNLESGDLTYVELQINELVYNPST
jgi:hypothetical protein